MIVMTVSITSCCYDYAYHRYYHMLPRRGCPDILSCPLCDTDIIRINMFKLMTSLLS